MISLNHHAPSCLLRRKTTPYELVRLRCTCGVRSNPPKPPIDYPPSDPEE